MSGNESLALYRAIAFSIIHVVLSFGTFTLVYVFPCSKIREEGLRLHPGGLAECQVLAIMLEIKGPVLKEAGLL